VLRSVLGAATLALAALSPAAPAAPGAAVPAPAYERGKPSPVAGLTLHPEWGTVTAKSGVLRRGCHTYTYRYAITPPEGVWAIEVFISGPGLKHVAAGAFLDGYDPRSGTGHYKLCKATVHYGRFKIETKLSIDDGAGHITEGRLPRDTFRLHKPRH
jgi:hypothetical protein